ncbi:MAG TPA: glycosyltransferase 87 family protein [Acidimicrobiales bacterium]|nr:glycosyltransferase 87 family protein [Acidimicrobiales bacterium]
MAFHVASCAVFLCIIFVRGGPNPGETDAHADTDPATAISHGHLRQAEEETAVPNPPGYPLLTAPFVLLLRPVVGSPRWCDDKPIPAALRSIGAAYFSKLLDPCASRTPAHPGYPIWYRSQAVLAVVGWIVLLVGAVGLLGAAGAGGGVGELLLVVTLLALPATTDAVAQSFHPQDLMSVGFSAAACAQGMRRRWVWAGVLFGLALLCKQFALLAIIPAVALAPDWRGRLRLVAATGLVGAVGVLPFYLADPAATTHALSATYVEGAGVVKTPSVIGLLDMGEYRKLVLARDLPLLLSAGIVAVVWRRAGARLRRAPVAVVGLVLACLATRLVFEVSMWNYYFLAVGAFLLILDMTYRRPPWWSLVWIVGTRYGLQWLAPRAPTGVTAAAFLAAALLGMAVGLVAVRRGVAGVGPAPARTPASPPGAPARRGRGGEDRALVAQGRRRPGPAATPATSGAGDEPASGASRR